MTPPWRNLLHDVSHIACWHLHSCGLRLKLALLFSSFRPCVDGVTHHACWILVFSEFVGWFMQWPTALCSTRPRSGKLPTLRWFLSFYYAVQLLCCLTILLNFIISLTIFYLLKLGWSAVSEFGCWRQACWCLFWNCWEVRTLGPYFSWWCTNGMLFGVVAVLDFFLPWNINIFLANESLMFLSPLSYFNRVKIIMEKDALKNPLTSRSAASARLLLGQVHFSL